MTLGTKKLKNGKIKGCLIFDNGKKIVLKENEYNELKNYIEFLIEAKKCSKCNSYYKK